MHTEVTQDLPGFSLNYSVCMVKFMPKELAKIYLETFAKMRKKKPELFVNFDMVGEEDTLNQIDF